MVERVKENTEKWIKCWKTQVILSVKNLGTMMYIHSQLRLIRRTLNSYNSPGYTPLTTDSLC